MRAVVLHGLMLVSGSRAFSAPKTSGGFRVLEWIPSQQALVKTAKFAWGEAWKTMMSELAPQSPEGDYVRPAPQVGSSSSRIELVKGDGRRYELYVGNACPWCHRAVLALALRERLDSVISVTELEDDAGRASRGGWVMKTTDPVFGVSDLKQVYDKASGGSYSGRCTAPLLVDAANKRIAISDSADIARAIAASRHGNSVNLRPECIAKEVDEACDAIYVGINDAVYRCGFCTSQQAYDRAEKLLHDTLADIDTKLSKRRFVCSDKITLADVWLYPTISRFDDVYAQLFRCGRKRIVDYSNIQRWFEEMRTLPGVAESLDVEKAKESYFTSLFPLNPSGIVPRTPSTSSASAEIANTAIPASLNEDDERFYHFSS